MKLYKAFFVLYLAAVAVNIAYGQGSGNGNDNGQYNVGASPARLGWQSAKWSQLPVILIASCLTSDAPSFSGVRSCYLASLLGPPRSNLGRGAVQARILQGSRRQRVFVAQECTDVVLSCMDAALPTV